MELGAGKSTLAQQLAARLNLPNVLQTDIIYQVLPRQPSARPKHGTAKRHAMTTVHRAEVDREASERICC